MSRKGRNKKQQKSLEKKFNKQQGKAQKPQKKDKYAHFKGKHAIKPGDSPSFE